MGNSASIDPSTKVVIVGGGVGGVEVAMKLAAKKGAPQITLISREIYDEHASVVER